MGHKHSRDEILAGALEAVFDDGLSRLTVGRLAKRLGISDRIIVYYFPSKDDLITEVMAAVGVRLSRRSPMRSSHRQPITWRWPGPLAGSRRPDADPIFSLFFEANGLAAATRPYQRVMTQLIEAGSNAHHVLRRDAGRCRAESEAAIALIDGLLLLRQLAGPDAADRAARHLGVA